MISCVSQSVLSSKGKQIWHKSLHKFFSFAFHLLKSMSVRRRHPRIGGKVARQLSSSSRCQQQGRKDFWAMSLRRLALSTSSGSSHHSPARKQIFMIDLWKICFQNSSCASQSVEIHALCSLSLSKGASKNPICVKSASSAPSAVQKKSNPYNLFNL